MSRTAPDPFSAHCPSRGLLEVIASKWTLLIVAALARGPLRTSELERRVGGISAKMLSQTLRTLEGHGLVERRDYGEVPPRVDYRLTALGQSLCAAVAVLDRWVVEHFWTVADRCAEGGRPVGHARAKDAKASGCARSTHCAPGSDGSDRSCGESISG